MITTVALCIVFFLLGCLSIVALTKHWLVTKQTAYESVVEELTLEKQQRQNIETTLDNALDARQEAEQALANEKRAHFFTTVVKELNVESSKKLLSYRIKLERAEHLHRQLSTRLYQTYTDKAVSDELFERVMGVPCRLWQGTTGGKEILNELELAARKKACEEEGSEAHW